MTKLFLLQMLLVSVVGAWSLGGPVIGLLHEINSQLREVRAAPYCVDPRDGGVRADTGR